MEDGAWDENILRMLFTTSLIATWAASEDRPSPCNGEAMTEKDGVHFLENEE